MLQTMAGLWQDYVEKWQDSVESKEYWVQCEKMEEFRRIQCYSGECDRVVGPVGS
jgi:hypothetical protein